MMNYKILRKRDLPNTQPIYDVLIYGKQSDRELINIATNVVKRAIAYNDIVALSAFFWKEGQQPGKESAMASVDWAPNGEWGDRFDAEPGVYENFEYKVQFNDWRK